MVDPSLDAALTAAVEERFEREQVAFLAELVSQPSCTREPEDVQARAPTRSGSPSTPTSTRTVTGRRTASTRRRPSEREPAASR